MKFFLLEVIGGKLFNLNEIEYIIDSIKDLTHEFAVYWETTSGI